LISTAKDSLRPDLCVLFAIYRISEHDAQYFAGHPTTESLK